MSFWAGVVQGVKDVDVLKEKEALAEERKAADAEAKAYRDKMFEYNSRRDAAADSRAERTEERLLEDRAWARAQTAALEVDKANAVLGGTRPSAASGSGGGGGGSAPAANDIKDSNIQFNGWVETQLKDEALSSEDADYITGVVDSFTDPKDAHEFWTLYTDIRESTGQAPSVEQLRNTIRVTQVPGYADNRKQAEEMLAVINGIDATTPEGLLKVRTLSKQLESIDLNAATIDADTSGYVTSEERPKLYEDQAKTFETELTTNWLSEEEQNALESAPTPAAATILMSRYRTKYGAQALATLKSEYPREFREAHRNPAFRGVVSADAAATTTTGSGGTEGGTTTISAAPGDTPATLAEKQRRMDAVLANPDDPEAIAQANEAFGAEAVAKMKYGSGFEPSAGTPTGKPEGAAYGIEPSSGVSPLEVGLFPEESVVAIREQYGEEFGQEGTQKVVDTVKHVWNNVGDYMLKGADRGAGMALGSANEVLSWMAVGLGGLNEVMGLDGTDAFKTAGEFDEVAGKLWNGGISAADASQKIADIWVESLTRDTGDEERMASAYGPKAPPTREEINTGSTPEGAAVKEAINALVSGVQTLVPSESMPNGYRPTQMGATELNLPKVLEALSPETRKIVEAELQLTPGDTNLERTEQSRLDRVGMESDRLSTESKSMPNGYTPTQIGATELNSPKVRSALDAITAEYVEAKGGPLDPDEELAIGIEALIKGLTSNVMPQDELDSLVMELQEKFTPERVREALSLAMNQ